MPRRSTRALSIVHVEPKRSPTHAPVECLLTECSACGKFIAHEDAHTCQLAPDYRQARAASRAHKATELRALGIAIRDERSAS